MIKDIVYFDVETTGIDTRADRIIEIYLLKEKVNGDLDELHFYFNTDAEIKPDALNKHGITKEFLMDKPYFKDSAVLIKDFITGCDLSGFNIINFDIAILYEELYRCGIKMNLFNCNVFDVFKILTVNEPRTLSGYYKRTFGEDFEDAHSAKSDVTATRRLFKHQVDLYYDGIIDKKINTDVRTDNNDFRMLDYSGFFKIKQNVIYYNKGKYKNNPVDVDMNYLKYISSDDSSAYFDVNVRFMATMILNKMTNNQ